MIDFSIQNSIPFLVSSDLKAEVIEHEPESDD